MSGGEHTHWDCSGWTQEDTDEFVASILVGPIIGIVLGLIMVILTALPLCCGVMKAQGKIIAMVAIPLGIIACLMPLFLSMTGCPNFVEALCDNCEDDQGAVCDNKNQVTGKTTRQELEDGCAALGFLVAYLLAYGWAAVVLGITAAGMACCILCGCCKMKEETTFNDGAQTSA